MSTKLATILADFTTNLASALVVGGTTATLQSAVDDDGVALPNGTYFFTLDGENSSKEHIVCTLTGTALSAISTVSRQGVEATGVARSHRIGATVSLTDFGHILFMNNLLRGVTNFDAGTPLSYDGTASITGSNMFATKAYVDGVAIAGAPDATVSVKGIVKMSIAPVSSTSPIAVGDNDLRLPQNSYATDSGSANAYAITLGTAPASYAAGQIYAFKATNANTGASTLNVNAVGLKNVFNKGAALTGGEILAGQIVEVRYDGTQFQMISPASHSNSVIQIYAPTAAGTATLDFSKGNVHHITMPAGNITIAVANAVAGQCAIVRILQDATGSRTVTWFSTIKWVGGVVPTLTTTASKADTFGFEVTGSATYDGYTVGQNI